MDGDRDLETKKKFNENNKLVVEVGWFIFDGEKLKLDEKFKLVEAKLSRCFNFLWAEKDSSKHFSFCRTRL
jgi:hypothetical protein